MKHVKFNFIKFVGALLFTLQIGIFLIFLAVPLISQAQSREDIMNPLKFKPQISIPNSEFNKETTNDVGNYNSNSGEMNSTLLARYIAAIYNYGLAIAAILATLVLMGGGLLWLVSAGDSGKIGQAKELITGSITGMVILVIAWIILNTINPNLVNLQPIVTQVIKKIEYCCDPKFGNVLMDKDGNCPSGDNSQLCTGNMTCENQLTHGNGDANSFSCINKADYGCCQYHRLNDLESLYCEAIPDKQPCSSTSVSYPYYYDRYYYEWCPTGINTGKDCAKIIDFCAGKDNGSSCKIIKKGSMQYINGYCYNDVCWDNNGKINEPCGNEIGSKCFDGIYVNQCPDNYKADDLGGRDCGKGLYCCYPDPK